MEMPPCSGAISLGAALALPVVPMVVIHFFSAAILASPIIDGEPALAPATDECDSAAVDEFFPKKRDRNHAVWFDVPTRGGIGMIHVAKRKCPQVMFRYLNHLSKEEGREGWSYRAIEHDKSNDALLSPTKVRAFLVLPQSLCFVAVAHACLLFPTRCCSLASTPLDQERPFLGSRHPPPVPFSVARRREP